MKDSLIKQVAEKPLTDSQKSAYSFFCVTFITFFIFYFFVNSDDNMSSWDSFMNFYTEYPILITILVLLVFSPIIIKSLDLFLAKVLFSDLFFGNANRLLDRIYKTLGITFASSLAVGSLLAGGIIGWTSWLVIIPATGFYIVEMQFFYLKKNYLQKKP